MHLKKLVLPVIALLLLTAACGGKYGGLQLSDRAEKSFLKGELQPNLTYYYFGREAAPDVIMGLDRGFVLDNPDMWYPIKPQTPENLRGLVRMMYDRVRMERPFPPPSLRGFRMLDQYGRYVGDWYSLWGTEAAIKSDGGTHVVIYPPRLPHP
jgi:hypothetical protein